MAVDKRKEFQAKFIKYISEYPNNVNKYKDDLIFSDKYNYSDVDKIVEHIIIQNKDFSNLDIDSITFKYCLIRDMSFFESHVGYCSFSDCVFVNCEFSDFKFIECDIINCIFVNCKMSYVTFGDVIFQNTEFFDCNELLALYFGGCTFDKLEFANSFLEFSRFEQYRINEKSRNILFKKCNLIKVLFMNTDLSNSIFSQCFFSQSIFANNKFTKETFLTENDTIDSQYSSIDMQTILNSDEIDALILRNIFGINNDGIKEYIYELTSEVKYQSVFISYSFKNREFAAKLNHELRSNGVSTFLWEKDAPGGKPLKKIMSENIQKYDRLLFIASTDSLKSKACQFELSEARRKTDEMWETIFFSNSY